MAVLLESVERSNRVGTIRQSKRLAEWQPAKLIQRVAKRNGQLYRQDLVVQLGKFCPLPKAQYKAIQHNIRCDYGFAPKESATAGTV